MKENETRGRISSRRIKSIRNYLGKLNDLEADFVMSELEKRLDFNENNPEDIYLVEKARDECYMNNDQEGFMMYGEILEQLKQ